MTLGLKGLVTGIGSLPHTDPEAACDLVFKHVPQVPFWPQLPRRDLREGMVAQFTGGLPCIDVTERGVVFNPRNKEKELEVFYERIIARDVDYFGIEEKFAGGFYAFYRRLVKTNCAGVEFIKLHITGPLTVAASIKDDKGTALLHDQVLMQAIIEGLSMKALWQIKTLGKFGKKMILFIDEPLLSSFGSAYTPINREEVVNALSSLALAVKSPNVLLGVHCCGNTDWSIFTDMQAIDIINFDAFSFLDKVALYAPGLAQFIQRGGALCWGIVPTQDSGSDESVQALGEKVSRGLDALEKKGLPRGLALQDLFFSPACGLGSLGVDRAQRVFELLGRTAASLSGLK